MAEDTRTLASLTDDEIWALGQEIIGYVRTQERQISDIKVCQDNRAFANRSLAALGVLVINNTEDDARVLADERRKACIRVRYLIQQALRTKEVGHGG